MINIKPTQDEIDRTQYFYNQLKDIYAAPMYQSAFPTEKDEKFSKREWFQVIGRYTIGQIDRCFDVLKMKMGKTDDYRYINVGKIVDILKAGNEIVIPKQIDSQERLEERQRLRNEAHAKWREDMMKKGILKNN